MSCFGKQQQQQKERKKEKTTKKQHFYPVEHRRDPGLVLSLHYIRIAPAFCLGTFVQNWTSLTSILERND